LVIYLKNQVLFLTWRSSTIRQQQGDKILEYGCLINDLSEWFHFQVTALPISEAPYFSCGWFLPSRKACDPKPLKRCNANSN
jgi:hypothetical protein